MTHLLLSSITLYSLLSSIITLFYYPMNIVRIFGFLHVLTCLTHLINSLGAGSRGNLDFNLAPALLASLYRSLYHYLTDSTASPSGPLWLLYLWLFVYFPGLRPENCNLDLSGQPLCCAFTSVTYKELSFCFCFGFFYEGRSDNRPSFSAVVDLTSAGL